MSELTPTDQQALINAIALREGTAKQLSRRFGLTIDELKAFLGEHREEVEEVSEQEKEVSDLWITNKNERLLRLQTIADKLYQECTEANYVSASEYATVLREFRSYCAAVANELGQLLHRGAGDAGTDSLTVDFQGVELEDLR